MCLSVFRVVPQPAVKWRTENLAMIYIVMSLPNFILDKLEFGTSNALKAFQYVLFNQSSSVALSMSSP
jgi:hypothetical protein